MRTAVILSIFALVLAGCSRKTVGVPIYVHDAVTTVREVHDSVAVEHIREVTKMMNGDTVRVTDSVLVERWKVTHDTLLQSVEVPVTVTRTEVKEVGRRLRWWQEALIWSGGWAVIATACIVFRRQRR